MIYISICLRWCTVNHKKLPNIKCLVYVFPCDFAKKRNEVQIYGTGGMILQNMKNLLQCLPGLERLELVDLQLDGMDGTYVTKYCRKSQVEFHFQGEHVLDEVSEVCRFSLKTLKIVNITRMPFSMLSPRLPTSAV